MLVLDNLETTDAYSRALTLESKFGGRLVYVVANASARARFRPLVEHGGSDTAEYGPETLLSPQSSFIDRISAVQFRSAVAGVPARVIAQLSEPGDILPASGTPFTQTLTASGGVGAGVGVYDKSSTIVIAGAGSAAERDIYNKTIAAGDLLATSVLELLLEGDYLKNLGTDTFTFRAYLGATKVLDTGAIQFGNVVGAQGVWVLRGGVILVGALNSQEMWLDLGGSRSDVAAPTTGQGILGSTSIQGMIRNVAGVDMSSAQALRITVQCSSANANHFWRRRSVTVWLW